MKAEHIDELGINNIFLATGSSWRKDGIGRSRRSPIKGIETIKVYSPEEAVQNYQDIKGPHVVYDHEQGYLARVIADHLISMKIEDIFGFRQTRREQIKCSFLVPAIDLHSKERKKKD